MNMERSLSLSRLWLRKTTISRDNHCFDAAQGSEWRLQNGQVQSFCPTVAKRLVCQKGVVWITQTGQAHDTFLLAGEEMELKSTGKVVMQAMSEAAILRLT